MDGVGGWVAENWFNLLSAVGIVGGLLLTTISLRSETKTRRIANLLKLTEHHREIWSKLIERPSLARVLDPDVNLLTNPITLAEQSYVNMLIQHLSSAFQAMNSGLTIKPEGLRRDVQWFFSLPIPQAIWSQMKPLQNDEFVEFVDLCRGGAKS